ncbi:hypothetical protein NX773_17765 [Massilia solisilvae]|uniref:Uncharacterized protein n=1 Tax=Massilia solisilvae TaxID=1811225 RepID=A0ABT2BND4_9BURK|nr:hypothetical protein [Massilia solisilvae]MCS0610017.1 hypothetical protein [Massilia solisilvae]
METSLKQSPAVAVPFAPGEGGAIATAGAGGARAVPTSSGPLRVVAAAGWISFTFGAWQVFAPRMFAHIVGMRYPSWLLRAAGARDMVVGAGMLAQPASHGWRNTRVLSDVLDTGLIGAAALDRKADRGRLAAFALVAAGVIALDIRAARARRRTGLAR